MNNEFAAGASAARNKVARSLRDIGIEVLPSSYGCPPKDEDFVEAIAELQGDSGYDVGSPQVVISFCWWNSTFYHEVPASVLDELQDNPTRQHRLFSATSPGGRNIFYLASDDEGNVVVHQKKAWRRGEAERLDTTVVRLRARKAVPGIACPVCGAEKNAWGKNLETDWAVACHLAGRIESGDEAHTTWAQRHHPTLSRTARGYGLAHELYPAIRDELGTG